MPVKVKNKAIPRKKSKVGTDAAPTPNWPALQPLVPVSELSLETLLPDQIVVIRNFWTSLLCENYVSFLSTLPLVTTPGQPKKGEALRVNDRYEVNDPAFAEQLWSSTALRELATGTNEDDQDEDMPVAERRKMWGGEICGLNPRIRIYRYREGQFFDQHYDESNTIVLPTTPPTPAKTTWTLLLYLTGPATGCIGGETVFYPELGPAKRFSGKTNEGEPVTVSLEVGMALLHKHGQDCLLHEGREVMAGEKWVIRTDLCVKR
ncbi:MAG: Oxoglutarate iron-dependent oxygenase [Lasallia pustulata]|uniref:Oxoglutarate iron-dependent oxygenase n=1 Tax=Lasallia pustulata TaxID=136370 RepID=A0A5M8PQQ9_9LECA|nr:MAG: Oxoglutarate iron-dependent oxygenase [Lasallia pustulata]